MRAMIRFVCVSRPLLCAVPLAVSVLWPLQAQAFLSDDEARKAILDLRQRVEVNRQAAEAAAADVRETQAVARRSLLELAGQIDQLRTELARVRGQNEQLAREVADVQRQQKDVQSGIDQRLRQVEPLSVTHDDQVFSAAPAEKREFESAMEVLRRSEFDQAATAFGAFLRRYPESGYTPSALYWLGNAQYANRAYKESMETHRRLVSQFPAHQRTPEAMLAMANSQIELKDSKTARRTLEDLVKAYPASEAATAGRDRLTRLR
jgi:tol-pal system protein YbgF